LGRGAEELTNPTLLEFYEHLLACLNLNVLRNGVWTLLDAEAAWDGNWTTDCFVCFAWTNAEQENLAVVVNFAPNQSQCYLRLPFGDLPGHSVEMEDLMGHQSYERNGTELYERGMYFDIGPWGYYVLRVKTCSEG